MPDDGQNMTETCSVPHSMHDGNYNVLSVKLTHWYVMIGKVLNCFTLYSGTPLCSYCYISVVLCLLFYARRPTKMHLKRPVPEHHCLIDLSTPN